MMNNKVIFLLLGAVLSFARASGWYWGRCPNVDPLNDFEVSGFLGKWYVIQKAGTIFHYEYPTCLSINYDMISEDTIVMGEALEYGHLLQVLFNRQHEETRLTITDPDKASCMRQTYLQIYQASYCIIDTDYENFAAIYECQNYSYMHKQAVTILSRNKELNSTIIDNLRSQLSSFQIRESDYMTVDHEDCTNKQPNDQFFGSN